MLYLINDPAKGGKGGKAMAKRPVPKGFSSWRAYMAHIRGFRKTKGGGGKARKARKTYSRNPANPPATRAHKRRRYHRNPVGSIPARLFNGVIDAGEVLIGKGAARVVPGLIGMDRESTTGLIAQAAVGAIAGIGAHYVSPNAGKMVLAGGFSAPIESLIKKLNTDDKGAPRSTMIASAFGDEDLTMLSAFPAPTVELGAWPGTHEAAAALGDDDDGASFYQQ